MSYISICAKISYPINTLLLHSSTLEGILKGSAFGWETCQLSMDGRWKQTNVFSYSVGVILTPPAFWNQYIFVINCILTRMAPFPLQMWHFLSWKWHYLILTTVWTAGFKSLLYINGNNGVLYKYRQANFVFDPCMCLEANSAIRINCCSSL